MHLPQWGRDIEAAADDNAVFRPLRLHAAFTMFFLAYIAHPVSHFLNGSEGRRFEPRQIDLICKQLSFRQGMHAHALRFTLYFFCTLYVIHIALSGIKMITWMGGLKGFRQYSGYLVSSLSGTSEDHTHLKVSDVFCIMLYCISCPLLQ